MAFALTKIRLDSLTLLIILTSGLGAVLFLYLAALSLSVQFTSDDYVHLFQDASSPWYYSSDHLFRPLRNGVFKMLAHAFGDKVAFYRITTCALYLADAILVARLTLALRGSLSGAIVSCVFFAFFPRNHAVLFWFASSQDLVVIGCALVAVLSWLRYRDAHNISSYLVTLLSFIVALGFKETAVVIPLLLPLVEMTRERVAITRARLEFAPFALAILAFGLYVHVSRLTKVSSAGSYGFDTVLGVFSATARTLSNLVLPFEPAFALREVHLAKAIWLIVILLALTLAALRVRRRRDIVFAVAWIILTILPTAAFARTVNGDHYLLFPLIGLSILIAFVTQDLLCGSKWLRLSVIVAVVLYMCAGTMEIRRYAALWKAAASELEEFSIAVKMVVPQQLVRSGATFRFVNVPHNRKGFPVLNNGLKGVLIAAGYPRTIEVDARFSEAPPHEPSALITKLSACGVESDVAANPMSFNMLYAGGKITTESSQCAAALIAQDMSVQPWLWQLTP